jgi:prepilin-type N-terminal cleavage/methylation domain-containing protein
MRGVRRAARVPSLPAPGTARDAGFTLIEVLVSISLIGVVMAALTTFFVSAQGVANVQDGQQTAVQLATDGIEAARALSPADLLASPPSDQTPPTRNGITFTRTWSVTSCWQPPTGGDCGGQASGYVPFLRAVVTVTWPDTGCQAKRCSYTTGTLVSAADAEPLFAP